MELPRTPERLTAEDEALLESFRARYAFPLDPFQERALGHVLRDESVIVSAPTGAGKTLIAEFAIAGAVAKRSELGSRVRTRCRRSERPPGHGELRKAPGLASKGGKHSGSDGIAELAAIELG